MVGPDQDADTELSGTIVAFTKGTLNVNQLNEVREQETNMVVEVVWRNLRTGEVLSDPTRRPNGTSGPALPALPGARRTRPGHRAAGYDLGATAPGAAAATANPQPVLGPDGKPVFGPDGKLLPVRRRAKSSSRRSATSSPKSASRSTTAQQQNVNRLAVQIVSMMEKPW